MDKYKRAHAHTHTHIQGKTPLRTIDLKEVADIMADDSQGKQNCEYLMYYTVGRLLAHCNTTVYDVLVIVCFYSRYFYL